MKMNCEASDIRSRSHDITFEVFPVTFQWAKLLLKEQSERRAVNASFLPVNTSALEICLRGKELSERLNILIFFNKTSSGAQDGSFTTKHNPESQSTEDPLLPLAFD